MKPQLRTCVYRTGQSIRREMSQRPESTVREKSYAVHAQLELEQSAIPGPAVLLQVAGRAKLHSVVDFRRERTTVPRRKTQALSGD